MAQEINGTQKEFTHRTYVSEDGTILYDMPVEAATIQNLKDFDATPDDFVTIKFGGTDGIRVLFVKTPNRELAEYQWSYLTEQHNEKVRAARCMVPGKHGGWVICHKDNDCRHCPFGKKPEQKTRNTISWDRLIEKGYEPEMTVPVETQVIRKIDLENLQARMDDEDKRLWQALWRKEIYGDSVSEIASDLGLSDQMVYKLVQHAKEIAREYRRENSYD